MPLTTVTLRCFASMASPPVSLPTTLFFQPRSASRSISGWPNFTPQPAIDSASSMTLRGVQQRLGRNAAHVQAHAAKHGPALDQRDVEPEIRCAEGGGVAAGAGAEHEHVGLQVDGAGVGLAGWQP